MSCNVVWCDRYTGEDCGITWCPAHLPRNVSNTIGINRDVETIITSNTDGEQVSFQKVKHGEWVNREMGYENCSVCGYCFALFDEHDFYIERNFCPNCGADMRERRDTNESK